jgi:Uma2 family endonuclease
MSTPAKQLHLSIEEYLERENKSSLRHEYVDGQAFAMTGATIRHCMIVSNINAMLHAHLRGGPGRAYMNDAKVSVTKVNSVYYPDVVVACGAFDGSDLFAKNPVFVVEVLSPSTAAIDQREKVSAYRQIASVQEYLIVHQKKPMAQLHRKNSEQHWEIFEVSGVGHLTLEFIPSEPLLISLDAIYEGVDWPKRDGGNLVREQNESEYEDIESEPNSDDEGNLHW